MLKAQNKMHQASLPNLVRGQSFSILHALSLIYHPDAAVMPENPPGQQNLQFFNHEMGFYPYGVFWFVQCPQFDVSGLQTQHGVAVSDTQRGTYMFRVC